MVYGCREDEVLVSLTERERYLLQSLIEDEIDTAANQGMGKDHVYSRFRLELINKLVVARGVANEG
jgi:hypothetical protein